MIGRAVTIALVAVSGWADVSFDRIRNAEAEPGNWLTYSRTYSGQRYTPLTQINTGNVDQLRPVSVHQPLQSGKFETSPIVVDGIVYISSIWGMWLHWRSDGTSCVAFFAAPAARHSRLLRCCQPRSRCSR